MGRKGLIEVDRKHQDRKAREADTQGLAEGRGEIHAREGMERGVVALNEEKDGAVAEGEEDWRGEKEMGVLEKEVGRFHL